MDYSIDSFWLRRLGGGVPPTLKPREGWSAGGELIEGFVEPPLAPGPEEEFGDVEIDGATVILIAAPGAVGKTTFTRQISALTGAIHVDLSRTGAIGDNFLSGGLHKVQAYDAFRGGDVGLVVDGLDEALLKTSTEGLADFLKDVLEVAEDGSKPIVIAGRVGSINEAWLLLAEHGVVAPVVQIEFFNEAQAYELARGALARLRAKDGSRESSSSTADDEAVGLLLGMLRDATESYDGLFAGYAPVLEAVAKQVAAYTNPYDLVGQLKNEGTADLRRVVEDILRREQGKVGQITLSDPDLHGRLYSPEEQVARLVQHLFGIETRLPLPAMSDDDRATYETAMKKWLGEHPFLDGFGTAPSSAVFGGYLAAEALRRPEAGKAARDAVRRRDTLPNPFLSTFYLPDDWERAEAFEFSDLADVPLVHASLVARLPASDRVTLEIDGVEDEDEVDVYMTWKSAFFEAGRVLNGRVTASGSLAFGGRITDVRVDAEGLDVELGNGIEAVLFPPVEINARSLLLDAHSLTVEAPRGRREPEGAELDKENGSWREESSRTYLSSREQIVMNVPPAIRVVSSATLSVSWPGSKSYPWTEYSTVATRPPPPELAEAYGRLRKIVMPFKSDKYGPLAKYKEFVNHHRRTKGTGNECLITCERPG